MADQTILVNVGANISDLTSAMNTATRSISSFVNDTRKGFQALGDVGKIITGVGIGIAAGLGAATKKAMDFEQQMSNVKAVSAASAGDMQKLTALAQEMGAKTKYSSVEAAKGIEELVKAGVSVKDIMSGGLEGALSLATAGELDLAEAAGIASTALNAFKKDGITVTRAADLLAGAANASATDVHELRYALSMVSAVASGAGLSFQDTSTALAVFAQSGLKGSDAGTSLKTMLLNLIPQTKKEVKLFDALGVTAKDGSNAFFDASGNIKSMAEIAQVLQDKLKGLTNEQRMATLQQMFGTDAIRAANILYNEGAAGINKMYGEMSKVTAAEVAAEKMNNVKGQVEKLRGAVETMAISIGNSLLPLISLLASTAQALVNKFNSLSDASKTFLTIGAALTAAFALFIGPLLIVIGFIPAIVEGFAAIAAMFGVSSGALLGLIGVTFGWIAAIVLVVTALVLAYNEVDWFRNAVNAAWAWIVNATKVAAEAIKVAFGVAVDWTVQKFSQIKPALMAIGSWISEAFTGTISAISSFFGKLNEKFGIVGKVVDYIKSSFDTVGGIIATISPLLARLALGFLGISGPIGWIIAGVVSLGATLFKLSKTNEGVRAAFESVWNGIKTVFEAVMTALQPIIDALVQAFIDLAPQFAETGKIIGDSFATLGPVFAQLGEAFGGLLAAIVGLIPSFGEFAKTIVSMYATVLPQFLSIAVQVFQTILSVVSTVLPVIISLIKSLLPIVLQIITVALPLMAKIFAAVFQMIGSIIVAVMPVIVGLIQAIVPVIMQIVTTVLPLLLSIVQAVFPVIMSIIQAVIPIIVAVINIAASVITNVLVPAISFILKIVQAVFPVIVAVIKSALEIITNIIKIVTGIIKGDWSAVWEGIKGIFIAVWEAIKAVVTGAINVVKAIISGAWALIKGLTQTVWNGIKSLVSSILLGIVSVVTSSFNAMKSIISSVSNSVKGVIQTGWNAAIGYLKGIDLYSIGKNILQGLINGIKSMAGAISTAVQNVASAIPAKIKNFLGIHSPSRVLMELGEYTGAGFVNGIKSMISDVKGVTTDMAAAALPSMPQLSLAYETPSVPSASQSVMNNTASQTKASTDPALLSAIQQLAGRPVSVQIAGREVALATSSDMDAIFAKNTRMDFRSQGGKR
jgi:TP901 family phage tail tape measure protein